MPRLVRDAFVASYAELGEERLQDALEEAEEEQPSPPHEDPVRAHRPGSVAPVDTRGFLEELTADDPDTAACLVGSRELRAQEPQLDPFPEDLPEIVRSRLGLLGIEGLYPHQSRGLETLRSGGRT